MIGSFTGSFKFGKRPIRATPEADPTPVLIPDDPVHAPVLEPEVLMAAPPPTLEPEVLEVAPAVSAPPPVAVSAPPPLPVMSFTEVGTTSWTAPDGVTEVEYLVVGGGGGGGNGYDMAGGGGGGGGMVLTGTLSVTPGQTYTVTVGDGGKGGEDIRSNRNVMDGDSSVFATVTALGGDEDLALGLAEEQVRHK